MIEHSAIVLDIFNGEGYSEPFAQFCGNGEEVSKVTLERFQSYNSKPTFFKLDRVSEVLIEMRFEYDGNNGTVTILKPLNDFAVITYMPDVCEFEIEWFNSEEEARKSFIENITLLREEVEDRDELVDTDRYVDTRIGGHTGEGYLMYELIKTS